MRITVDAAMRARDVSRPRPEGEDPPPPPKAADQPPKRRKGELRRLGKRAARTLPGR